MITIFGNLRINDPEKLQHLKDSFLSFNKISDNWVLNIRGNKRKEAISFLKKHLGKKATFFNIIDESRGWSHNALKMIGSINCPYVLLWNEDHINTAEQEIYADIAKELSSENIDVMWYSWWINRKLRRGYEKLSLNKLKYVDTILLTKSKWKIINTPSYPFYIISMMGIFKTEFFKKLLIDDTKMFPFSWTIKLRTYLTKLQSMGKIKNIEQASNNLNKLFRYKFRRFPEYTPFNLEKDQTRTDILPLKIALPKRELFACIDDDLTFPGYSLISRGLYKRTQSVKNTK